MTRRRIALSACFGVLFFAASLIGDACAAGRTWRDGAGHAIVFGTFGFFVLFPILLLIQAGITRLVRKLLKRPPGPVPLAEFLPIAALSVLLLAGSVWRPSPESYFQRFVADVQPVSVRDIQCWFWRGFGGGQFIVSFKIAPEDFERILTRHPYKKKELTNEVEIEYPQKMINSAVHSPVAAPKEPMAFCYSYMDPDDSFSVEIYTNKARDTVYVIGGD